MSNRTVIAIEGINGLGKSTAMRNCRPHLLDLPDRYWWFGHEMQDGLGAEFVRMLKQGLELSPQALALMYAAARIDSYERRCADQHLRTVLVYDRFLWSSLAYHSVRCDPLWVQGINQQSPRADFNILLDADPEQLAKRDSCTKFPGTYPKDIKFLQTARQNFLALAEQHPGRVAVIDAMQEPGVVAAQVAEEIRNFLSRSR